MLFVVHADTLSRDGILDGIRKGNVFIDVEWSRTRLIEVEAASGKARAAMGGTLIVSGKIDLTIHVVDAVGGKVEIVTNGLARAQTEKIVQPDQRVKITLGKPCGWATANVRNSSGALILIGNPVYLACVP